MRAVAPPAWCSQRLSWNPAANRRSLCRRPRRGVPVRPGFDQHEVIVGLDYALERTDELRLDCSLRRPPDCLGSRLPVAANRCISLIVADGLIANRRAVYGSNSHLKPPQCSVLEDPKMLGAGIALLERVNRHCRIPGFHATHLESAIVPGRDPASREWWRICAAGTASARPCSSTGSSSMAGSRVTRIIVDKGRLPGRTRRSGCRRRNPVKATG